MLMHKRSSDLRFGTYFIIIKKSKKRYHYGENSEDALINSFFTQYQNTYYKELSDKIKNLLNKINTDKLTFNTTIITSEYQVKINAMKDKITKIIDFAKTVEIPNNKFKILPYTDILHMYLIYLLIIIDYLTICYV